MKFRVNWPFCSEEKVQNRFSTWLLGQPSWISNQNDFSCFWSTSHPYRYCLSSFESLGLSVQENKFKIDFKDGDFGGHIAFLIWTIFAIFELQSSRYFLLSFKSSGLSVQEKKWKIDFQDGSHGGHLGFPIGTILDISDLQVTLMLSTKFQVNWPFSSGEEAKNRFPRWWPSWTGSEWL